MLLTSDRRQISIPNELRFSDERCWQSVELGLSLPMFFCTMEVDTAFGRQQRAIITALLGQLKPAKLIGDVKATLVSVDILSPGWLNKSGSWKMDGLRAIEEASSLDGESWSLIYILENGQRYTEVTTGTEIAGKAKVKTILKCPTRPQQNKAPALASQ